MTRGDHLYLIDGSGYLFRAYHALPPLTRKSDGLPTGAVSGYCNMLWRLLADMQNGDRPTHVAVIFDAGKHTFRNDIYPAYKANRPPVPEDLRPQIPLVRDATRAFGVSCVELAGFEADDLIATYARLAREAGARVTVVSSDKDLMQLVVDGQVQLFDGMKNKAIGSAEVIEKFGVPPSKVVDVQSLAGDSTDNVPGVPGIGIKTAAELINAYGDLETLLARAGEIKQPKRRAAVMDNADKARLSLRLVTLNDHVAVTVRPDTFAVRGPDPVALLAFLRNMEFAMLTRQVEAVYPDTKENAMGKDLYEFWRNALAGNVGPIHETEPECGFWRKRMSKGGPFTGVAIFPGESDELVAMIGRNPPTITDALSLWTWVVRYPVTEEFYRTWEQTGKWPDDDAGVLESLEAPEASTEPGANNPPKDEAEELREQIESASKNATAYKTITDDETAAKAQGARSRLLELAGTADKQHDKEKAPHLEAGRAVDKRWFPLRDTAKAAADAIRVAIRDHENRKLAKQRETERLALEAARKAEQARLAAIEAGKPVPPPPPPPPPAPPQPAPSATIRGGYGRAATKKMIKVYSVTDQDAAYAFVRNDAGVVEAIAKAAKRFCEAGSTVPGVTVTEEMDVR
jgi:5'-3' exonuclease